MKIRIYLLMITFFFFSCTKDKKKTDSAPDKYLSIHIQPIFGNSNFYLDSIYETQEGYKVKFLDIKFYLSAIRNGNDTLAKVALFDFRSTGNFLLKQVADASKFSSIQGNIGVIQSLNHQDPSAFPNDSPLNISNAGAMHWSWNTGYIFVVIEGKADTIPDGTTNPNHNFSFHVGSDSYLQSLNFSNVSWQSISETEKRLSLNLDVLSFLQNPGQAIDLKKEFLTHSGAGSEVLTLKVAENFKQALKIQ